MQRKGMVLLSALAMALIVSLAGAQASQIIPYSNSTQAGYHIINASTDGETMLAIGNATVKYTQNYITPATTGVTIDNASYYLNLSQPVPVMVKGQNGVYLELVRVYYIPRLHTVDVNFYINVTTTTTTSTTVYTTTAIPTTSQTTAPTSTTIAPTTTTTPQTLQDNIGALLQRILAALEGLLSKL